MRCADPAAAREPLLRRCDPAAKLAVFLLLVLVLALAQPAWVFAAAVLLLLLLARLGRQSLRRLLRPLLRLLPFLLFLLLMHAFFSGRADALPLWPGGWLRFSAAGLAQGMRIVLRLLLITAYGSLLLAVTSSPALTHGLQRLLQPLAWLGLPARDIALILGVAAQFIPILQREIALMLRAQTARGAGFAGRSLRQKAANAVPLLVPIFVSAFRRADALALAMEARGYQPAPAGRAFLRRKKAGSQAEKALPAAGIAGREDEGK